MRRHVQSHAIALIDLASDPRRFGDPISSEQIRAPEPRRDMQTKSTDGLGIRRAALFSSTSSAPVLIDGSATQRATSKSAVKGFFATTLTICPQCCDRDFPFASRERTGANFIGVCLLFQSVSHFPKLAG
jgi:hypothetical protein